MRRQKLKWLCAIVICVVAYWLVRRYGHPTPDPLQAQFIKTKHAEARSLASTETNPIPPKVWAFFRAAERNDIKSETAIYAKLSETEYSPRTNRSAVEKLWDDFRDAIGRPNKKGFREYYSQPIWTPIYETDAAIHLFRDSNPEWIRRLGGEIASPIGTNSVLFTTTDLGRIAVLCTSGTQLEEKSSYAIALNALADGSYMEYLRQHLKQAWAIPTPQDSQNAFQDYMQEAQRRLREFYRTNDNSVPYQESNGSVAVWDINSKLARVFMAKNPGRKFYVSDVSTAEWMLPNLEPAGPIMRLRAEPLGILGPEIVQRDRNYWSRLIGEWLGDWLGESTSVEEVCRFGEAIYVRKDFSSFKGDISFVADERVRVEFGRMRASIGRVYAWQADHAASLPEQQRLRTEADFAFRQAIALSPFLMETAGTCADFLKGIRRRDAAEAVLQLRTRKSLAP
jgi:hypothetical protein